MHLYIGIDPGKRTGACLAWADYRSVHIQGAYDIPGGVDGFLEWWQDQASSWAGVRPLAVICEDFVTREGKHGIDHTPERVIGALRAECRRLDIPLIMRPPSGRLKQMPDWAMVALIEGLDLRGNRNRNAKEAVRHLLAYLKSKGNRAVLEVFREESE